MPAVWTVYLGMTDYRLTGIQAANPQFVGLDNYRAALVDPDFRNSLWLTLLFVLGSAIIGQTVAGFALAWTLRGVPRPRPWRRRDARAAGLDPAQLDRRVPLGRLPVRRRRHAQRAARHPGHRRGCSTTRWRSIIVFNTWRGTAFSMLLFSAALRRRAAVAAGVGPAGRAPAPSQQLRDVVLPHIRGHVLTNTLLISLWTFNDFSPYLLTAGGPNHASETLPVYIYNEALYGGQLGYGSAISFIMLLINLVIALFYVRLLRERR